MPKSSKKINRGKTNFDSGKTTANDNVRSCCPSLSKPPARPEVVYSFFDRLGSVQNFSFKYLSHNM
jgi:hypothetical protein